MHHLTIMDKSMFQAGIAIERLPEVVADPNVLVWLDLDNPTDEEAALLRDVFQFHPLAIEDTLRSRERPKVDIFAPRLNPAVEGDQAPTLRQKSQGNSAILGVYYFIVFYSAVYNPDEHEVKTAPVSLFIGPQYLVTVHTEPVPQIGETRALLLTPNNPVEPRVGGMVHALLDAIVDDYFPIMDRIADRADDLEDAIFAESDEKTIQSIFTLKKQLLRFRHVVAPERDVVNVLLRRELPVFRGRDVAYLQDVYDHLVRLADMMDTYRDLLSSVVDSYLSIQSNELNKIVRTLTVGSILLMAGALIAGIYGMNFEYMPELSWKWGYPWALGLMLTVILGLAAYFKKKHWF
jgi:magnesium transporter